MNLSIRLSIVLLLALGVADAQHSSAQECCPPSWIFMRSTYTHAPETGARVAQYDRPEPVEGLEDPRLVTSGYRRTRTTLRGADGSVDSSYQVQSWGNGRGGPDAEWERFHDAWLQSSISGGYYGYRAGPAAWHPGWQPGYGYGHAPGYGGGHAHGGSYGGGYGGPYLYPAGPQPYGQGPMWQGPYGGGVYNPAHYPPYNTGFGAGP